MGVRAICAKFLTGKDTRPIFEVVQNQTFWEGNPVNAKCQTLQRFKLCLRLKPNRRERKMKNRKFGKAFC